MKKRIITMGVLLSAAIGVQASVVHQFTSNVGKKSSVTMTVNNLNAALPTATSTVGGASATGAGYDAAGTGLGGSFSFTATAANGWSTAGAQTAVGNSTFGSYLGGLTSANVAGGGGNATGLLGVRATDTSDNSDGLEGTSEVLVFTFANNITGGSLVFNDLAFGRSSASAYIDVLILSAGGTVTSLMWDSKVSDFGSFANAIGTGDKLVIATGATNTDGDFRFDKITLDVIPEPATLGLIAFAGTALLFIRRRLMM